MNAIAWIGFIYCIISVIIATILMFIEKEVSGRVARFIGVIFSALLTYFFFNYLFY